MFFKSILIFLPILIVINFASTNSNVDRFKRAVNRTYLGFEKEKGQQWTDPFTFIHAADPQFGLIERMINQSLDGWKEEIQLTEAAVNQWNNMKPKPKFVVISGDLVNEFPSEKIQVRKQQIQDLKKVLSKLDDDIPLVLMGGNHDFNNVPTLEAIEQYKNDFGDDYYSFWFGGCMFLVINDIHYKQPNKLVDLYKKHHEWIKQKLAQAKSNKQLKHLFILQHIPWFIKDIKEKEEWNNIGYEQREKMLNLFKDAGVRAVFTGHLHGNNENQFDNIKLITTSAIGYQSPNSTLKSGYRIVNVTEDQFDHVYHEINIKFHSSSNNHQHNLMTFSIGFIILTLLTLIII